MKKFAKVENGVVVQTQRSMDDGFAEVPENVSAGMVEVAGIFSVPGETPDVLLRRTKRRKKRQIKNAANVEMQKLDKELDTGDVKICRWLWPAIDQTMVNPKLITLIEIDRLMRVALKAVRQATTIAEVDAVPMPVWP